VRTRTRATDPVQVLVRNDPRQYDDLAPDWWQPRGRFAALHWLAEARAALVPPATRPGSLLVDVGCGGGLLAPRVTLRGHRYLGVDLTASATVAARSQGLDVVQGDAARLPLPDGGADVVVAGEILEHVPDLPAVTAEICRVLRPGGTLVIDTIAATRRARVSLVHLGERLPGGPPRGIHDPALFVDRRLLIREAARHGVPLTLRGLRPDPLAYLSWLAGRRSEVPMVPTRSTATVFTAVGIKSLAKEGP